MFALRRWWDRYATRAGIATLVICLAWAMRQSQGAIIYEAYQVLTSPLHPGLAQAERLENAYILELQQRVIELENQNQGLRENISYAEAQGKVKVAAVIGRSADNWWQQITVNKGSSDGITEGDMATGPGGLVGRVVSASPSTSQILLITDPTSQMGVKVSRSRALGVVRGNVDGRVVMQFFETTPDVKPGDVIVTSSYSRLFTQGVPVGRIESMDLKKSPAPEAVIQLSSPLNILEWVTIHPFEAKTDVNAPPAEIIDE
ncbi:MAG: rod shape-determining protein MreC [Leptolyngbya sp. SIO3F4]|nr:rod shape-determining protein MreC [Leptolyngbya sp. SIO3F4]